MSAAIRRAATSSSSTWSQGEIRHNTWYNEGASNPEASPEP